MRNTICIITAVLAIGCGCLESSDKNTRAIGDPSGIVVATYAIPHNVGTVTHDPEIPAIGRFMDKHEFSWSGRFDDSDMVIRVVPDQAEAARQALRKAVDDGRLKRITVKEIKTSETTISEQPDEAVTQESVPSAAP